MNVGASRRHLFDAEMPDDALAPALLFDAPRIESPQRAHEVGNSALSARSGGATQACEKIAWMYTRLKFCSHTASG